MQVCRLIYRSVATAEVVSNDTLADLERKAGKSNAERGITGLLVLAGNVFVQALEGDPVEVTALFARIVADSRHKQVELVSFEGRVDRLFSDWAMRLVDVYDLPGEKRAFMTAKYRQKDDEIAVPSDVQLMHGFLLDAKYLCLSEPWHPAGAPQGEGTSQPSI